MDQTHCPICLDLTHELFDSRRMFSGSRWNPDSSVRYRAIKFDDLRTAALAGCQNCFVLKRGTSLFWGSNPENTLGYYPKALLVLESRKGSSLIAFRSPEEYPHGSLNEVRLRIEFFTQCDHTTLNPAFGHAYRLPRFLSKDTAARRLRSWLQYCEDTHASCSTAPTKLPARVLDISGSTARLLEFQETDAPYGVYATLSHCWGDPDESEPTTTTKVTLTSRKMGIEYRGFTDLFQDAIQLCKEVGCDYIWIDSLCIVQDDNSDWTTQSQKMAEIYTNAHFNIAATSSANSTQGLFKERWTLGSGNSRARNSLLVYEISTLSAPTHKVLVRPAHNRDHEYLTGRLLRSRCLQAPLLDRAWVFQELLLARRILHVCASELIWECKSLTDCECGALRSESSPIPAKATSSASEELSFGQLHRKQQFTAIQNNRSSPQKIHDFWLRMSQQYSNLYLTKPSDRLAALMGLVNAVQKKTNGTHVAGIWIEDLLRALLWGGIPRSDPEAFRSNDAPTWSWMSRRRPDSSCFIGYHEVLFEGFQPDPKASVTYVPGPHTLPNGKRFEITFQGRIISAKVQKIVSSYEYESELMYRTEYYIQMVPHLQDSPDPSSHSLQLDCPMSSDHPVQPGDMVECLLLGTDDNTTKYYTLVVSKCVQEVGCYYKRIGISIIELKGDKERYSDVAELRQIAII